MSGLLQCQNCTHTVLLKIVLHPNLISVALVLKGTQKQDTLWLTPCATSECGGCRISVYDVCTLTDALGACEKILLYIIFNEAYINKVAAALFAHGFRGKQMFKLGYNNEVLLAKLDTDVGG